MTSEETTKRLEIVAMCIMALFPEAEINSTLGHNGDDFPRNRLSVLFSIKMPDNDTGE